MTEQPALPSDADVRREAESSLQLLPPVQPAQAGALDSLDRSVKAVTKAEWLAERLVKTDFIPKKFAGKMGDATAAILFGAEVGLSPIASLRSIIVIHGMPGFEARTMKAILMANGYHFRTVEATREVCTIVAESRDGRDEATATITMDDCVLEGWVPKPAADLDHEPNPTVKTDWQGEWKESRNGNYFVMQGNPKYLTSPRTMLIAKATAAVCRDIAPHLLLGLAAVEEITEVTDLNDYADTWPERSAQIDREMDAERPARRSRAARNSESLIDRARAAAAAANTEDAEVVDLPADEPPPAGAEPEETTMSDTAATPPPPEEDDVKLTDKQRSTGIDMMHALFSNGGLPPERGADRLVVAEAILGHPVPDLAAISNRDLKALGAFLKEKKLANQLVDYVGDVLDNAAIDAARDAEDAAKAADQ